MRNKLLFFYIICSTSLLITNLSMAQNMNSPYSIYGVGDIDSKSYNRTSGMGGTGLALRSSYFLIDNNPAAISGLTRSFFMLDAAVTGKLVSYKGDPIDATNSSNKDFWIKRLSLAVKLNNYWASSIGFGQFSTVNYKFYGTQSVEGSSANYLTSYEGEGGLNEYYWNNAVSLSKHLSLGIKSSIIAGGINRTETVADESIGSAISTKVQDYYGKPRFQFGAMYTAPVTKKLELSLGGKCIPQTKMPAERLLTVTQDNTTILDNEAVSGSWFSMPETFGAGVAVKHNRKTTFAADYTYEDWSSLKIKDQGWQMISNSRLAAGAEFSRQARIKNVLMEKRFFQLGGFYNTAYLQVRNQPIKEFGITAGMGGVIGNGLLYTFSLEAGKRGTTQQKLIRENYVQMTFTFSYRDFLASKGRKYD